MEKEVRAMVHEFIEVEKRRAMQEAEVYRRLILEEFVGVVELHRGASFDIAHITADDLLHYERRLNEANAGMSYFSLALRTVGRFLDYALHRGWMKSAPWEEYIRKGKENARKEEKK